MACEDLRANVDSIRRQILDGNVQAARLRGAAHAAALLDLKDLVAQLKLAQKALADCLAHAPPPPPVVVSAREILEIQWTNPTRPDQPTDNWATGVVGGTGTFPDVDFEWLPVLNPADEYDDDPVGATGWIIQPDVASNDFPFLHPFGNDFEFSLALDVPRPGHPADADYSPLLAPANATDVKQRQRARDLGLPPDVLGVEVDGELVPRDVVDGMREGNRAAVFGRWIIDTAHYDYGAGDGTAAPGFRAEIHPPLLMASAGADPSTGVTRAVFTSRPYLVGQTFGSPDTLYQDGIDDDGAFTSHVKSEAIKVLTDRSLSIEVHPKIKSHPFRGAHLFHFIVRPAPPNHRVISTIRQLSISFNFTVRSGCALQVSSDGAAVHVFVTLNSAGYNPPPLPTRREILLSREQLTAGNPGAAGAFEFADMAKHLKLLLLGLAGITWGSTDGITTDTYDSIGGAVLGRRGAVLNASPLTIRAGQGITTNDAQPYPVTGWLEVGWQNPTVGNVLSP